jgi:hypothetical protein
LQDYAQHLGDAEFVVNDEDAWMCRESIAHAVESRMPILPTRRWNGSTSTPAKRLVDDVSD